MNLDLADVSFPPLSIARVICAVIYDASKDEDEPQPVGFPLVIWFEDPDEPYGREHYYAGA